MSTKSKEDQELLDQKIARIKKQNEAILLKQQKIEEDKKFAEQNDAMVKLRPSTDDWPRERTPALRPSRRESDLEKGGGDNTFLQEHHSGKGIKNQNDPYSRTEDQHSRRNIKNQTETHSRAEGFAPPPDPKSFLFDPERCSTEEFVKDSPTYRGRNFQRGEGHRRGRDLRGRGSTRGIYRGMPRLPKDDAWRQERHQIDEDRINRQKAADGKWRREWDNQKHNIEIEENAVQHQYQPYSRGMNSPHSGFSERPDLSGVALGNLPYPAGVNSPRGGIGGRIDRWKNQPSRGHPNERGRGALRGGRGRSDFGRNAAEPIGYNMKELPPNPTAAISIPPGTPKETLSVHISQNQLNVMISKDSPRMVTSPEYQRTVKMMNDSPRLVKDVGGSFEIVVPNNTPGPAKFLRGARHLKSWKVNYTNQNEQVEYPNSMQKQEKGQLKNRLNQRKASSQCQNSRSSDETPLNKEIITTAKPPVDNTDLSVIDKTKTDIIISPENSKQNSETVVPSSVTAEIEKLFDISKCQKPDLPPFRTSLPKTAVSEKMNKEVEDGEESWEDVSASDVESDDCDSIHIGSESHNSYTDLFQPNDSNRLVQPNVTDAQLTSCCIINEDKSNDYLEYEKYIGCEFKPEDFIKLIPPESKEDGSELDSKMIDEKSNIGNMISSSTDVLNQDFEKKAKVNEKNNEPIDETISSSDNSNTL